MARFNQGIFKPKNREKYFGRGFPTYRSSWELTLMNLFDSHPNVEQWASEAVQIPYMSPFDGRWHKYIPDFIAIYVDKNGKKHGEVIEVKPSTQTYPELAKSKKDKQAIILNQAKWKSAIEWCKQKGLEFRIMTEEEIYRGARKSPKK